VPQFVQLYEFAENKTSRNVPTTCCFTFFCTTKLLQQIHPKFPRKPCQSLPRFMCSNLLLYGSVQYGLSQQNNTTTLQRRKCLLGICALALLGNVPTCCSLSSPSSPQKSLLLLLSMCLAHYPMHSFINMKMTFSLQSVFSPSPTLNPKAKI
jgi:hypothetical protein